MQTFKEINLPSLTERVKKVWWIYINPYMIHSVDHLELDPNNPKHRDLFKIMSDYPFLNDHMVTFKVPAGSSTAIHVDGFGNDSKRIYSCNIPILGCTEDCVTEFYHTELDDFVEEPNETTRFIKPDRQPIKINEYSLVKNPILANTQIAHRVNNQSTTDVRISVSWSVKPNWTMDMIAKMVDLKVIT